MTSDINSVAGSEKPNCQSLGNVSVELAFDKNENRAIKINDKYFINNYYLT